MPAFNFSAQFAALVQSGAKRMTIRRDRADGRVWPVGVPISLYSGMRTKRCRLLGRSTLVRCVPVLVTHQGVRLGRDYLSTWEIEQLATADGFGSVADFVSWFLDPKQRGDVSAFAGHLYAWGDLS